MSEAKLLEISFCLVKLNLVNPFYLVPTHNIAKVWAASNAPSQADFGPKLQAKSAFLHKSLKELQPIF